MMIVEQSVECELAGETKLKRGKAVPVTGLGGPYDCETSSLPHLLDNWLTGGGGETEVLREILSQCDFVHHKSHIT
jgi:hypothetical protein